MTAELDTDRLLSHVLVAKIHAELSRLELALAAGLPLPGRRIERSRMVLCWPAFALFLTDRFRRFGCKRARNKLWVRGPYFHLGILVGKT